MRGWKSLSFENFLVLMMFDGKELLEQQQMSNVLIFELIILIKFKEYSLMSPANVLITQIIVSRYLTCKYYLGSTQLQLTKLCLLYSHTQVERQ